MVIQIGILFNHEGQGAQHLIKFRQTAYVIVPTCIAVIINAKQSSLFVNIASIMFNN